MKTRFLPESLESAIKYQRSLRVLFHLVVFGGSAINANALAPPSYVQGNYAVPQTPQKTVSVPYAASQTAGDLDIVVVGWNDSVAKVSSVVDSQGNSYQLAAGPTVGNGLTQSIYCARNIRSAAANANVVTINYSAAAAYPDIRILEYIGIDPINPVEGAVSTTNNGPICTTAALKINNTNDLLFGANTVKTSSTRAQGGFTQRILTKPDGDIVQDKALTLTGSYSANVPLTSGGGWVMQLVAFRGATATSTMNELQCLRSMPVDLLEASKGSFPDSQGREGSNQTGVFEADEQRGAMQGLTVAIGLQNDAYVANEWSAVPYTYSQQDTDGSFVGLSTSAFHMRFWMSWSCHALVLLKNDPHYGPMYRARLQALLPKIELSMDYLLANGACSVDKAQTELWQDFPSPNRSIIISDAFYLGAELLTGYSKPDKIAAYRAMGQQWLDNEFKRISGANLFRAADGDFLEPGGGVSGVDTSYQGLSTTFLYYWIFSNARTGQGTLADAVGFGAQAGNFVSKRYQLSQIDDTYDTRSGPGNLDGAAKTLDKNMARLALMHYNAIYNIPEVLPLARSLATEPEVNGLPPNLITKATFAGDVQIPLAIQVYFTNAGIASLDPAFRVQITGLPAGLTAKAPTFIGASSASVIIAGTPVSGGSFTAVATATNRFGTNHGFNLHFTISSAP
jgi:hypothetical protein